MRSLYSLCVSIYFFLARVLSLFSRKAYQFVSGRKHLIVRISSELSAGRGDRPLVWFHCASAGEFEQARPLIEALKVRQPEVYVLLTFFSPSGYELRKNYRHADAVFYLPADTVRNAVHFISAVRPDIAVFVKYEFWYNLLHQLKTEEVPTYIISAIFRPGQAFFKWYGGFLRKGLRCFTRLFVQNQESVSLLAGIGIRNAVVAGDTRFDRVRAIRDAAELTDATVETFADGHLMWVAGSSWAEDEKILASAFGCFRETKLVVVPHEVEPDRIAAVESAFSAYRTIRYSACTGSLDTSSSALKAAEVLIVDCVGILSTIYRYGRFAYIGGGFHTGIHNILEAAVYDCPVIFGPQYRKFQEAKDLVAAGGAFSVASAGELEAVLQRWLSVPGEFEKASRICSEYVSSHLGATDLIMKNIFGRF